MAARLPRSTLLTKEAALAQREWYVIDLDGKVLGRAATRIASVLRGKHKPTYTPHVDAGDFVVVINADKVKLTGSKAEGKLYRHHTLFPGGVRTRTAEQLLSTHPDRVIRRAVWGMLPKGALGRKLIKKLKIYSGTKHEHGAQRPRELTV
jgi:large subunit ribosomal protein L13